MLTLLCFGSRLPLFQFLGIIAKLLIGTVCSLKRSNFTIPPANIQLVKFK